MAAGPRRVLAIPDRRDSILEGTITYLNTDLDLVSSADLTELVAALEAHNLFALHVTCCTDGLWRARLETSDQYDDPGPNLAAMVAAVESLAEPHRHTWFGCSEREFNMGYECGTEPAVLNHALAPELLAGIVAARATLGLTLYSSQPGRASVGGI